MKQTLDQGNVLQTCSLREISRLFFSIHFQRNLSTSLSHSVKESSPAAAKVTSHSRNLSSKSGNSSRPRPLEGIKLPINIHVDLESIFRVDINHREKRGIVKVKLAQGVCIWAIQQKNRRVLQGQRRASNAQSVILSKVLAT